MQGGGGVKGATVNDYKGYFLTMLILFVEKYFCPF